MVHEHDVMRSRRGRMDGDHPAVRRSSPSGVYAGGT